MACSEVELCEALAGQGKDKSRMPELSHDILARDYPVLYQSIVPAGPPPPRRAQQDLCRPSGRQVIPTI